MLAFCGTANASVVIDSFDHVGAPDPWPVTVDQAGASATVLETGLATVLGGVRTTTLGVQALGTARLDKVEVGVYSPPGILSYASSILADGKLDLLYDNGPGGLNVDLSSYAWIEIDLLAFDLASGNPMPVTITLADGASSSSLTQSVSTAGRQLVIFPFASFTKTGPFDFSSIDEIDVSFDPEFGADFRVGEIRSVVPEPATLGLLAVGAALTTLRTKRRTAV